MDREKFSGWKGLVETLSGLLQRHLQVAYKGMLKSLQKE